MMRVFLLTVLVSLASAGTLRFPMGDSALTEQWQMFKRTHNKAYESEDHETLRRIVWEANMRYIQRHNFEADMGKHTYRLGMNEYGDLTGDEFRKVFLGFQMNATRPTSSATFLPPSNVKVPDTVDWRKEGYVTKVKNQGQCGSCWAFSTTGSLEGQNFKKTGKLVSLSEQNLVDCSQRYGNNACNGGLMDNAFKYIKANGGVDTEESYPYTARKGRCKFSKDNVGATDTGFVDVKSGSESDLQNAVATVGPISVAIDASHMSFQLYRSGVYNPMICSSVRLDHGVLAVGYGTNEGKDYWLVKNSWGASWGMDGYIMMARNKHNKCGIATQASYPLV